MAEPRVINERYELQPLRSGRGGMGDVWVGHDVRLDREVAVKFVRFDDEASRAEYTRRFVRESRITARLQHPGVPAVFDVGTDDGTPYLVMQRVHGTTIKELLSDLGRLPVGWVAAIGAQVCSVLAAAHRESLVHRDLKPANIMLEPDGTVKVLDFGLAVSLDSSDPLLTKAGQPLGTPAYMAPEQVLAATSTPATDLYALGATLYELLTGEHVFSGPSSYAVMNKHADEQPEAPVTRRPDTPAGLNELIVALLAKKPEQRPESAVLVYAALRPFIDDLEPLPGIVGAQSAPSPIRMYAAVVGLEPSAAETEQQPVTDEPTEPRSLASGPSSPPPAVDPADIDQVRAVASDLAARARFKEAADLLAGAVGRAGEVFSHDDRRVVTVRLELANVLYEGGDYRDAAPIYQELVGALTDRDGPTSELTFRCRQLYAECQAKLGNMDEAITLGQALLADQQRKYRSRDPRPFELRERIATWQLAAGRRADAEASLRELHDDLVSAYGGSHPTVEKIRALLEPGAAGSHG